MTRAPRVDFWLLVIAVVVLCFFVSVSLGQDTTFRGIAIGGWRSSPNEMRCYRDGQRVQCGTGNPMVPAAPQRPQAATPSLAIVSIQCGDNNGSGCIVGLDKSTEQRIGVIFTASHILSGDPNAIPIVLADGRGFAGRVTASASTMDFAVIEFVAPAPVYLYYLSESEVQSGQPMLVAGHSNNGYQVRNCVGLGVDGDMVYARDCRPGAQSVAGATAYFQSITGMSGGPIIGADGKLYSVLNEFIFRQDDGCDQKLGGPSLAWIKAFLTANNYQWGGKGGVVRIPPGRPYIPVPDLPPIDIDVPLPGIEPDEPADCPPCAGLGEINARLDAIEGRLAEVEKRPVPPTLEATVTAIVDSLQTNQVFLQAIADKVDCSTTEPTTPPAATGNAVYWDIVPKK